MQIFEGMQFLGLVAYRLGGQYFKSLKRVQIFFEALEVQQAQCRSKIEAKNKLERIRLAISFDASK